MKRLLLPALILFAAGCAEDGARSGGGTLITSDGRFLANTDRNAKAEAERAITVSIGERLGVTWQVRAEITEMPELHGDPDQGIPEWRWASAHAHVVLVGPGTPSVPTAEIQAGVERYLTRKLAPKAPGPVVVTVQVQSPSAPPVAPPATSERRYTAQVGDTWADVSTAFYGSPDGWRVIRDANGGAERPEAGAVLTIPRR
jgi:nucleoid-associated protein YgaU